MQSIGRGATSEVFALDEHRAIKRLYAEHARAIAGAEAVRGLVHRNVVRIDEVGADYIVMERVHGETLAALLLAGSIDEPMLRELAAQIADGMAAVHARGIVHRDLKPANILLAGDLPKICDFGIATATDRLATATRIGTPAYMAPEQLTSGVVAPCVDVWAFGVILFEMATGALPFDGFDHGRCPQLVERAPAVTGVSSGLAQLIARCLEREPAKRPASMAQIAAELRGDARATQTVAPPVRSQGRSSRRRWALAVGASVASAAVAIALIARGTPSTMAERANVASSARESRGDIAAASRANAVAGSGPVNENATTRANEVAGSAPANAVATNVSHGPVAVSPPANDIASAPRANEAAQSAPANDIEITPRANEAAGSAPASEIANAASDMGPANSVAGSAPANNRTTPRASDVAGSASRVVAGELAHPSNVTSKRNARASSTRSAQSARETSHRRVTNTDTATTTAPAKRAGETLD
ncbi:MAG: protein kinase [Kofleriaceae bacterium]